MGENTYQGQARRRCAPAQARVFGALLADRYGVDLWVSVDAQADSVVVLSRVIVPERARGRGVARAVLEEFTAEADRNGWTLALTPDGVWGASVPRLRRWYASAGFVANRGRCRDLRTREAMVRPPAVHLGRHAAA